MSNSRWTADRIGDQAGRRVVVTGATSGIGKEAARVLAGKNAAVVIAARNMQKAQTTVDEIRAGYPKADVSCRELDLSSLKSVSAFAESYGAEFDRLDVLINNAGVMIPPYSKTEDGFEIQLGTNHLGHFALTGHLLPLLKKNAGLTRRGGLQHGAQKWQVGFLGSQLGDPAPTKPAKPTATAKLPTCTSAMRWLPS